MANESSVAERAGASHPADASEWPDSDKEFLGQCPVCDSKERSVLFAGVRDGVFGAPGAWTIRLCADCDVAYLDPRPTLATVGKAYSAYYTHADPTPSDLPMHRRLSMLLANGLIASRDALYRTFLWPDEAPLGRLLNPVFEKLAPHPVAAVAFKFRHLKPATRKGARLLDVGCGNGAFLPTASKLGYDAIGVDLDPVAVARGAGAGLDIRIASLEANDLPSAAFDHVTLSHVLEHFHDPRAALAEVYRLLAPGGRLWVLQPNLGALGLLEFGPHWRGLEAPRHMVLMKPDRLLDLLGSLSFVDAAVMQPSPYEAAFSFQQSLAIRYGEDPQRGLSRHWSPAWNAATLRANATAFADPTVCESMTVTAFKPR